MIKTARRRRRSVEVVALGMGLAAVLETTSPQAGEDVKSITGTTLADVIEVGAQAARVSGGGGDDTIHGGPRGDFINGNAGNDLIDGRGGDDTLHGGRGDDTLLGGPGDDWLYGDKGHDVLTGGPGRDRFMLDFNTELATVTDFDGPGGDRVVISAPEPPTIEAAPGGVVVRLQTGGRMFLRGVDPAGIDRWIDQPPAPHAAKGASWTILIVTVLAGAAGAFALVRRRRRRAG